ncbi:MAG: hypothetical protein HY747_11535 [Elusimicrobia bacterium]|nr:hypothetical protein [Elusimicrobiota bacterium]
MSREVTPISEVDTPDFSIKKETPSLLAAKQAQAQQLPAPVGPMKESSPVPSGMIPVPEGRKLQVAVMDFDSRGLSDIETGAVTDFFRSALVNTNAFVVVDRGNMEKILTEQKFQQTGCTTEECAVQMGKILNVEKIFYRLRNFNVRRLLPERQNY